MAAVIGHPIAHSLSPALHNAAFRATRHDWVFLAFDVPAGGGASAVEAMRTLGIRGMSVTMPLKAEVFAAVDRRSAEAERLGAVNTVAWDGSQRVGHNTDGGGFLDALRIDQGWTPTGRRCVVVGAGGAARAVISALGGDGAERVTVVNRTASRAESAARLAGPNGVAGGPEDVATADLVVNATPVGMLGDESPLTREVVRHLAGPGQLIVDLVYHPAQTAFLRAAAERGAVTTNGLGMLVHQAARAFELWTGLTAPREAMAEAARAVTTAGR